MEGFTLTIQYLHASNRAEQMCKCSCNIFKIISSPGVALAQLTRLVLFIQYISLIIIIYLFLFPRIPCKQDMPKVGSPERVKQSEEHIGANDDIHHRLIVTEEEVTEKNIQKKDTVRLFDS